MFIFDRVFNNFKMGYELITKLIAAGSMGVSIYCVIKVYSLLKAEQDREIIRSEFIKTIYVFMGFGIFMTAFSLFIEFLRPRFDQDVNKLEEHLKIFSKNPNYSIDKNGNPMPITLPFKDTTYTISNPLPNNLYENVQLSIKEEKDNRNLIVFKNNIPDDIVFGFLTNEEVQSIAIKEEQNIDPEAYLTLIKAYYPKEDYKKILNNYPKFEEDIFEAKKYLIDVINNKDIFKASDLDEVLKLTTENEIMKQLKEDEYPILIESLEKDRPSPFNIWQLSQLYFVRSNASWNNNKQADLTKYNQYLNEYIKYYESNNYIQKEDYRYYKTTKNWYDLAKGAVKIN